MMDSDDVLKPGDHHYKAFVGPMDRYDFMGATQFRLATTLGLRAHHKLLDFGCGSLRAGKLFIPYLERGNYFGLEPEKWLIEEGLKYELGAQIVSVKAPSFMHNDDFSIGFSEKFDYIVAQSIFTHTDEALARRGLKSIAGSLKDSGIAIVTFLEGPDIKARSSWVYPENLFYSVGKISEMLDATGLNWCRLWWFHPAQTWFVLSRKKENLPGLWDRFMLMGGEEVNSRHYKRQGFISNRLFSEIKKRIKERTELDADASIAFPKLLFLLLPRLKRFFNSTD